MKEWAHKILQKSPRSLQKLLKLLQEKKTFKSSTAERVPNVQPAPIYLRYIRVPFQINCRASAEGVQLGYHAGNVEVLIVEY